MSYLLFTVIVAILLSFMVKSAWESCQEVPRLNEKYMVQSLSSVVFGQDVAIGIITLALQTHMQKLKAGIYKPLVLSFHGSSGVGKKFLSSKIPLFLPDNTMVFRVYPSIHFVAGNPVFNRVDACNWICKNTRWCNWNIIIVEDAQMITESFQRSFEKMFKCSKGSWERRKLVVIFLSTLYSGEINNVVFDKVNYQGPSTFHKSDFEHIFERNSSNWLTKLYQEGLLDAFVPFLPLDKNSVIKCIQQELKRQNQIPHKDIAEEIVNYVFEQKDLLYSTSGCKKVADKVAFWLNSPNSYL